MLNSIEQKYLAIYVEAIDNNSMFNQIHKIERRVVYLIKSIIRKTGNIVRFRFVIPVESGNIVVDEKLNVITSKRVEPFSFPTPLKNQLIIAIFHTL